MIFVTLGTVSYPFLRLARAISLYCKHNPSSEVVLQSGYTRLDEVPKNLFVRKFFPYADMIAYIKKARVVVTAAGETTVYLALQYSKYMPVVVPRVFRLGEHVDTQQEQIGEYLYYRKLAHVVFNVEGLSKYMSLHTIKKKFPDLQRKGLSGHYSPLERALIRFTDSIKES